MKLGDITDIAVSGLVAQRLRLATTASNLANAETTRTAEGGAYRRRDPVFRSAPAAGPFASQLDRALRTVETPRVVLDPRPPLRRLDPGHPDADAAGYVERPRVNVVEELANMRSAGRSYQANLVILRKLRAMARAALQLGGGN